jgi:hypothetical protein
MDDLYCEEHRVRKVSCQECGQQMVVRCLWSHLKTQHDIYMLSTLPANAVCPVEPRRLAAVVDAKEDKYRCPVTGCPQGEEGRGYKTPFNLRWHFRYQHPANKVVIGGKCFPHC